MDSHLYRFHISGASQLLPFCFIGASNSILTSLLSKIAAPSKPVSKLENKQSNKKSSVLRKKAVVNRELSSIHFFFLPRTFVSQILRTIGAFLCFEKNFFLYFSGLPLLFLFMFGCAMSSLLPMGFLQLCRAGTTLLCVAWSSYCSGLSC